MAVRNSSRETGWIFPFLVALATSVAALILVALWLVPAIRTGDDNQLYWGALICGIMAYLVFWDRRKTLFEIPTYATYEVLSIFSHGRPIPVWEIKQELLIMGGFDIDNSFYQCFCRIGNAELEDLLETLVKDGKIAPAFRGSTAFHKRSYTLV